MAEYKWDTSTTSPAEIEETLREQTMAIFRGALEGIFKLDDTAREIVFKEMAKNCAEYCMQKWKLQAQGDMDIDTLISQMNMAGPERRNIRRVGDTIFWEACVSEYKVGCVCVLRLMGLLDPTPEICKCSTNWVKYIVEKATGRPVEAELVDSANTGSDNCHYRLHLAPSRYTSKAAVR